MESKPPALLGSSSWGSHWGSGMHAGGGASPWAGLMTWKESDGTLERAALGLEFTWNVLSCWEHSGTAVPRGHITPRQSIWTAPSASPSSRSLTPTCSSHGQGRGGAPVSGSLSRVLLGLSPRSFNPPFSYLVFSRQHQEGQAFSKASRGQHWQERGARRGGSC